MPLDEAPLLNAAMDAIVVTDERGRIDLFNAAAERMFGYRSADVVGADASRLVPGPDPWPGPAPAPAAANGNGRARGSEVQARRANGETFPAWLTVGKAGDGPRVRYVAIFRDLSERRAAEARLRSLEARLEQLGSLYMCAQIGSSIAHEINQPLSAIATYAQAARRVIDSDRPDIDMLRETCRKIDEQARRAGQVIRNIRELVREPPRRAELLDVNEVVAEIAALVGAVAGGACIDVCSELAPGLPPVRGDAIQLQQAILCLARNSMDAMRDNPLEDRCIVIATAAGDAAGKARATVRISVADRGGGVAPALAEQIFDPFVTTSSERLGLGLPTCRAIVAAHGGKLSYAALPGPGSRFTISLPVLVEEAIQ